MSFKRYLRHHIKSRLGYSMAITLIGVIVTLVNLIAEYDITAHDGGITPHTNSMFFISSTVLAMSAALSAILEFAPFLNRRNLDLLYSLPIAKRSLYSVHFLTGLLSSFAAHLASFILTVCFWLPHNSFFSLEYALPLYLLSLPCGYVMYVVTVFLFTRGNTVVDGIVTTALAIFALPLIAEAIVELYPSNNIHATVVTPWWQMLVHSSHFLLPWSGINEVTTYFQYAIENSPFLDGYYTDPFLFVGIFSGIFAVGTTLALFLTYPNKRVETVGEITTSWFSYRLLIPIYAYSLFPIMGISLPIAAFLLVAMFVGYVIYRRSYKLKLSDLIVLSSFAAVSSLMILLS